MAERYVSSLATAGTGTELDPWTWAEAMTAINDTTVDNGDRVNIKADGTYTAADVAITRDAVASSRITIEGYSGIVGDGEIPTIQRASGEVGHWIDFNSGLYYIFKNLKCDVNNEGDGTGYSFYSDSLNFHENVEVLNSADQYSVRDGVWVNCYVHHGVRGFFSIRGSNCIATNHSIGQAYSSSILFGCVGKDSGAGENFQNSYCFSCISDGGLGHGFNVAGTYLLMNCIAINTPVGKIAVRTQGICFAINCNFYDNDGTDFDQAGSTINPTYLDPQFTDPDNLDYTRTGDNLDNLGFNEIGMVESVNYKIDIGPFQGLPHYPTAITGDPFTAVYDTLWSILEDSTDFTGRVDKGNRIKYRGYRKPIDPEKPEVSTDDMPEVRIVTGGMIPHLQNTSSSSRMTVKYSIEVRSGSKDLRVAHYPIVWSIYRAMASWATRLTALTWNGKTYVILGKPIGEVTEGIERGEVSKGIEGWYALWTISVDCWFDTSDL